MRLLLRSVAIVASCWLQPIGLAQPSSQPESEVDVFVSGEGDYHTYRIPAIVETNEGTLLAYCEGRRDGRGDAGNVDLLVKRSTDGGATWSQPIVVWNDGPNTCGNPCPVVDRTTGTIWLPMTWNLGCDHESAIMAGKSERTREVYMSSSSDEGLTWSKPTNISASVKLPHWRWYATGPGVGIQLARGPHRRRLVIPANHSDHTNIKGHPYRSHVFWSDDHGKTWQLGGALPDRTNESQVAQCNDGCLLLSMRNYFGANRRAQAFSADGGASWSEVELIESLDTPVCQASLLRYLPSGANKDEAFLLFASPRGNGRSRLTVWMSKDGGKTWPKSKELYPGGAAYSCLVALPNNKVGVLYEKNGYKTITLRAFDLASLQESGTTSERN